MHKFITIFVNPFIHSFQRTLRWTQSALFLSPSPPLPKSYVRIPGAHANITPLLRQHDAATSFGRNNDVVITSYIHWGWIFHWNENVIWTTFSSLAASQVVTITTFKADSDQNFSKCQIYFFPWNICHCRKLSHLPEVVTTVQPEIKPSVSLSFLVFLVRPLLGNFTLKISSSFQTTLPNLTPNGWFCHLLFLSSPGWEVGESSWQGQSFRIAAPLWGGSTGHRWIPHTRVSNINFIFFAVGLNKLMTKHSSCRRFARDTHVMLMLAAPRLVSSRWNGKFVSMTALVVTGDVEDKLQRP